MSAVRTGWAVVVNDEDQYSVWPADSTPPAGWRTLGFTGSRDECLTRIAADWSDLRPASMRRRMDAA
ncbi:MbtH family protein [Streptomyces sp. NPDC048362]|uniref:MbtH family protein n=1 Tax=Streptomyces sp. NPDC048362 TaxID=3365539 RepID=UPI003717870C